MPSPVTDQRYEYVETLPGERYPRRTNAGTLIGHLETHAGGRWRRHDGILWQLHVGGTEPAISVRDLAVARREAAAAAGPFPARIVLYDYLAEGSPRRVAVVPIEDEDREDKDWWDYVVSPGGG